MATATDRTENAEKERLRQEVTGQLARARGFLHLAHRYAAKLPPTSDDREKSRMALAEATTLCVAASRSSKTNNLFQLVDSGLNPSEIRRSVQNGLDPAENPKTPAKPGRARTPDNEDQVSASLLAQLDACRRMSLEGLRCLNRPDADPDDAWRGQQFVKIAEQLCVITALESKLLGRYVMGDPAEEPAAVRHAVCEWAAEATRRELAGEG